MLRVDNVLTAILQFIALFIIGAIVIDRLPRKEAQYTIFDYVVGDSGETVVDVESMGIIR